MDRYARQIVLPQIGAAGQIKLGEARVLLIGCGALGCVFADQLARAGVGQLRVVDRDIVELNNLQRQTLFDETDAASATPKAIAAANRLARVNSSIRIEPRVIDVDPDNIENLLSGIDLIADGTDNVVTRFLINDAAVKLNVPWIYGACVGVEGRVMTIVPRKSACLRCVFPDPPAGSELPSCDTAGVLASAVGIVASLQAAEAIKLLVGSDAPAKRLITINAWTGRYHAVDLSDALRADCLTCGQAKYQFLEDARRDAVQLCGRNAVRIPPARHAAFDAAGIENKLAQSGNLTRTPYFIRCALRDHPELEIMVFADGRTIIHGTNDLARARSIYARYLGS
jgi:adenylyltransferase/sulfurtransferase